MFLDFVWQINKAPDGTVKRTEGISILAFLEKPKFDNEKLRSAEIKKAVNIVVNSYSKLAECNYINVQVRTGFNIGIFSLYFRQNNLFTTKGEPMER